MRHPSTVSLGGSGCNWCQLVDARFYTSDTLSLLINPIEAMMNVHNDSDSDIDRSKNQQLVQLSVADVSVHMKELKLPGVGGLEAVDFADVVGSLKSISVFEIAGPACHRYILKSNCTSWLFP